jgi:hypothetical protein
MFSPQSNSLPLGGLCPTIGQLARQLGESDDVPSSNEDGASSVTILLWVLCGISLLLFAYGLFCLTLKYPYVFIPIDFGIATLFSVLAFRSERGEKSSKQKTTKSNHPYAHSVAWNEFKQFTCRGVIPRRPSKENKETKKPSQEANDSKGNKDFSHHTPPRGES